MNTHDYIKALCTAAKAAAPILAAAAAQIRNGVLLSIADSLSLHAASILEANAFDLAEARDNDVPETMMDRLMLNKKRIDDIAESLRELSRLPDPIGKGERFTRPNGLTISRIRVPLGVVAMIYEARPNVTADAAAICIKSGNAAILRGGKEALHTNRILTALIQAELEKAGLPASAVSLVNDATRESANELMRMRGYIDVLIPRGGAGLIRSVVENASVPVIETGAGNCHLYVDKAADLEMALRIAINAKASRPSVCNAIETMLVHAEAAAAFLPMFAEEAEAYPIELRGCEKTAALLPGIRRASEKDYATEFHDYILAVKVVGSIEEALAHIARYSTGHSEAIVTGDLAAAKRFQREVDAAAVFVNASTRFTDGGEFGLGAEIGISTQKLHVRGPFALEGLTTVKYLVDGDGQVR